MEQNMISGFKPADTAILQSIADKTGIIYKDNTSLLNKTQVDGEQVFLLSDSQQNAKEHQVKIDASGATGTIAVQIKTIGSTSFDVLNDEYGQPVVIDLTASRVFTILIAVEAIKFVPSSVVGNYSVRFVGRG